MKLQVSIHCIVGNKEETREAKQVCSQCTAGNWLTLFWMLALHLEAPREAERAIKERVKKRKKEKGDLTYVDKTACHTAGE